MKGHLAVLERVLDEAPDAVSRLQLRTLEMTTDGPVPALRSRLAADVAALRGTIVGCAPDRLLEVLTAFERKLLDGPLGPDELSALFALLDGLVALRCGEGPAVLMDAIAAGAAQVRSGRGARGLREAPTYVVGPPATGKDGSL